MSAAPNTPTLAAQLTPAGIGGIAVIMLAGPDAAASLARCFVSKNKNACAPPRPGEIRYGFVAAADGTILDEVLVAATGASRYEINCHGGMVTVHGVLARLRETGAEIVEPMRMLAEYGPLREKDAVERDAYEAMLGAKSLRAARHLNAQAQGALSRELRAIDAKIETDDYAAAGARTRRLLETAALGLALARPPRVVIAGRPNAGKSSLLNAVLSYERAIVAATPGTTRDVVGGVTLINDVAFDFHDTAGLRRADSHPEAQGVLRAEAAMADAACVVYALDGSLPPDDDETAALARAAKKGRMIACLNKSDLGTDAATAAQLGEIFATGDICATSCLSGAGIEELRLAVAAKCGATAKVATDEALLFDEKRIAAVRAVDEGLRAGRPAAELRAALATVWEDARNS